MEGIPRVPMAAPEMKVPSQPFPEQLRPAIKEYIVMHYQDDPSKYDAPLDELEQMRAMISRCSADVESICIAKRYYAQLAMMKKRFPMEEHDPIAVPFAWTDRTLDLMNQLIYEDVNFEMCCIMFNIGIAHAQIAASETRTEMDSIKNAFMHFQCAAWPLQYLRDQMGAIRYSTSDFESPYLSFFLNLFLAQAQECMLEKSMIDHRKPIVVARVALQLQAMYAGCEAYLGASGISDMLSSSKYRELERMCGSKARLYGAIYNYYLGQHADDEKQWGNRLFYFARALELVKQAVQITDKDKKKSMKEACQFAYDVIAQRENNARRENDFIYHERIPRPDELPKYEGVCMVKPIGFEPCDPSITGEDLFRELLPIDVIKAISLYDEEKNRYRKDFEKRIIEKENELEKFLLSMKLDQLGLDQPADQVRLPDELLTASAAFTAQPDLFPDLLDNFQKVTSLATQAEKKLTELKHRMRQITNSFFTKDEGYIAISRKLEELGKHHAHARDNNAELQRAMATHSENLKLLSIPLPELTRQICGDFINPGQSPEGQQLQRVTQKVDEMQRQRCLLKKRFCEDLEADDITKKALTERELDPKKLFEAELKKHDKNRELLEQNMRAQENILKALTEANANFADYRRQIMTANEKRALHSLTLVTAYQVFMDIVEKTEKAMEFYVQLGKLLAALERGVKNIEEINEQSQREIDRKNKMVEEARRREAAVREEKRRQEEAAKEAARAVDEFRFH